MSGALLKNAAMRYLPVILGRRAGAAQRRYGGRPDGVWLQECGAADRSAHHGRRHGAGAVPLVEILSGPLQMSSADLLSRMVPAVVIANTLAILVGTLLARLGRRYPP